ncbi:MAG: hypothetical protein WAT91_17720 [Saprospiraceae bacterium]
MRKLIFLQAAKILLTILFGCSSIVLSAQLSMGAKVGLAKSWRANIPQQDDEYIRRTDIQFSILTYMQISKILSLGIEPGYVPRISSVTFFGFEGGSETSRVNVNYLALPLYLSGRYPLWNERLKMNVKAGYGISWLVHATREFQQSRPFTEPVIIKHTGWLNKMDHGFYTGIGIDYTMGKNSLRLESDFYIGLRDAIVVGPTKNRNLSISIGYNLAL